MVAGRLCLLPALALLAACAGSPGKDASPAEDEQAVDAPVPVSVSEHPLPEEWVAEEPLMTEPEPLLDVFVVAAADDYRPVARALTSQLREAGWRVDMTDRPKSIKAQFKDADRARAGAVFVIGAEWDEGAVTAKRLDTGEQDVIAVKEIDAWLRA